MRIFHLCNKLDFGFIDDKMRFAAIPYLVRDREGKLFLSTTKPMSRNPLVGKGLEKAWRGI